MVYTHFMKLSQLRAFLTTLERGTFSEAALDLGMSQSAVSYAVAELETSLGVTLLLRGRGGASATEIGEAVAAQARSLFQTEETIRQLASREAGALRGTLRVLTFRSVASRVMPAVLRHLAERNKGLQVKLLETNGNHDEVERALEEGRVDLAFVQLPFSDDFLQWTVLRDPYVAVRKKQRVREGEAASWKELAETPLILYGDHESTAVIEQYLAGELGPVEPTYQVEEDSTLVRMVAEGLGLTLMPASLLTPCLRRWKLWHCPSRSSASSVSPSHPEPSRCQRCALYLMCSEKPTLRVTYLS